MNQDQLNQLQKLVALTLENDNNLRQQAESQIQKHLENQRDQLIFGMVALIRTSKSEHVRCSCAIYLRNNLCRGEPMLYDKLDEQLQANMKKELLLAITNETTNYARNQISDTVVELAQSILYRDGDAGWPDLVTFLFSLSSSPNEELRRISLSIFGKLAENCGDTLSKPETLKNLIPFLQQALQDKSPKVREAACIASAKLYVELDDDDGKLQKKFREFILPLLALLADFLNSKNEDAASNVLKALVELATEDAEFFRLHLNQLAQAMLQISGHKMLDDGIRQLGVEVLAACCENAAAMCRKSTQFIKASATVCLNLMIDLEEDQGEEWCTSTETTDMYDNSNFGCAEVAFDRIAQSIKGAKLKPILFPILSEFMNSSEWRKRNAALHTLAQIADVIDFADIPLKQVVKFISDPHPRVRHAAIECVGQLCDDFKPRIQHSFHASILPALLACVGEAKYPRIQAASVGAIFVFIDECDDTKIIENYADQIMPQLLALLHKSVVLVQSQVITAIAAVAGAVPAKFIPYYKQIMPLLKQIFFKATDKKLAQLRARAIEAISFIGMSVGREVFYEDSKDILPLFLQALKSTQEEKNNNDDLSASCILSAWSRLSGVLKEEFVPYLHQILPYIYATIAKKENWNMKDYSDEECKNEDEHFISPTTIRLTSQAVTSQHEEKAIACSMLNNFAHELKEHYYPFIIGTLKSLIPCLSFIHYEDIRSYAATTMPDLIISAVETFKQGKTDANFVKTLMGEIVKYMVEWIPQERELPVLHNFVTSLTDCILKVGEILPNEAIDPKLMLTASQTLLRMLEESFQNIDGQDQAREELEDYDSEVEDEFNANEATRGNINILISDCLGAMMETHKQVFLSIWEQLLPDVLKMLDPKRPSFTRKIGVFIWDDFATYMGPQAVKYFQGFVPILLRDLMDPDPELRQPAAFGLGKCAEAGGQGFAPFVDETLKVLMKNFEAYSQKYPEFSPLSPNSPQKHVEEKQTKKSNNSFKAFEADDEEEEDPDVAKSAIDNCVACLGKIAVIQNRGDLLSLWLSWLPLRADKSEASGVYALLCTLVETNNPALLGEKMSNLPRVISVIARVLGLQNDWIVELDAQAQEEKKDQPLLQNRLVNIIKKLKMMPQPALNQLLAVLSREEKQLVESILSKS